MTLRHMSVPAVLGAIMSSALRFTSIAVCSYTRDGKVLYANSPFWDSIQTEPIDKPLPELLGEELWTVWLAEAEIVLSAGTPMKYVAELGQKNGHWITSRCAAWSDEDHERTGMMYVEVLPASRRRGIVVRCRVPLTEILQLMPHDAKLHHDPTLSQSVL